MSKTSGTPSRKIRARILGIVLLLLIIGGVYYANKSPKVKLGGIKPPHVTVSATQLSGVGTEPFRAFTLSGDVLAWNSPDWSGTFTGVTYQGLSGSSFVYANIVQGTQILTTSGSCSDGMSDTVYPASVTATVSGTVYHGCLK